MFRKRTFVRCLVSVCLTVGCFFVRQAYGVNAFSYIQTGLVACYDGIENAGAGVHDPNATTWVDLTGNGNNGTVGRGITWAANGWVNTSAAAVAKPILVGPSLAATTGSETFTMEFTGQRASTARATIFGQYSVDYGVNFEYTANGTNATSNSLRLHFFRALADEVTLNQYTTQATTFRNGDSATLALTAAPTERGLWKNGVLGTFTDTSKSASEIVSRVTTCNSAIGGDAAREGNSQFPFIGTCYAFRLYDRVLTTEELAINAAVDAVRFRNADPATLTLPAGWSFDAQENLVKTMTVVALGGKVRLGDGAAVATVVTNIIQDASSPAVTFTAVPDAGFEFVTWGGDIGAIISQNDTEVTVDGSLPVTLYAIFRPDAPPAASTAEADYVTDGLVVWYDGADNAGVGTHNANAATWADLSGNNRHATINSIVGWTANGWTNNDNGYPVAFESTVNTIIAQTLNSNTYTLEFTVRPSRTSNRENFFGSYNTGGLGIEHNSSSKTVGQVRLYYNGNPNYDTDVTIVAGEAAAIALVSDASRQKLYKNGQLAYTGTQTVSNNKLLTSATYYIGNDASRPKNAFKGTYYSFRLYNRLLTDEEVARNAAADRTRLLEAGATTWTNATGGAWLDAGAWDYGVPNVFTSAALTLPGASKTVTVTEHVPAVTNVTVANASGTTTVRVADGGKLPVENAVVSIGKGGELKVEAGGEVEYDGGGTDFPAAQGTVTVADGGKLTINGGAVNLNNFNGRLIASGVGSDTGIVSITSGKIRLVAENGNHGLQFIAGGRLEMTGGQIEMVRTTAFGDSYLRLTDSSGVVEMSGDASIRYIENNVVLGGGTTHLWGDASISGIVTWDGVHNSATRDGRFRIAPLGGQTAVVTVDDDAYIGIDSHNPMFYIGTTKNTRSILNWNSSKTLRGTGTFAVGYVNGYAELNLTRGQMVSGAYGFRVAQSGAKPSDDPCCVTGVVNMTGGSILNESGWSNAGTVHGLTIGAGTVVKLDAAAPSFFRGTLNLADGAVTNNAQYAGIGLGAAEGDVLQTGGEFRHQMNTYQMIVGAFGGTGRYVLSNGVASAESDVFVGGVTTNLLYHKPYNLHQTCPVTNHCSKGLLRVAGGAFATEGTLWLSQDGEGVLEIGPTGTVTAANVTLTNTPAALTGDADLAAKVKFTFGQHGVGTLTTAGALTIGPGATLEVDATALDGHGVFTLISFGSCEGDFSSVSVTGGGAVVKTSRGYVLDRSSGTVLTLR